MLSRKGKNNENGSFNWKDALVDAGIMAGLTFFTSLGGLNVAGVVVTEQVLIGAGVAGCTEFFLILAIKRGLREKEHG